MKIPKKLSSGRKSIEQQIYDAPVEEIENRIVTLKKEKEVYDAEQEQRRIQRILEEERRILEMRMEMKKKEEREKKEEKKED